jgi:hypothetical protein
MNRQSAGKLLKSISAALFLAIGVYGAVSWLKLPTDALYPQLVMATCLYLAGAILAGSIKPSLLPEGFLFVFLLVCVSPSPERMTSYYLSDPRNREFALALVCGGALLLLLRVSKRSKALVLCSLCLAMSLAGVLGFVLESGGRLIFSDDHPAFLYRLSQLKSNFPAIPFYNPSWNSGVEAREFFPSGSLGLFFLWAPVVYFTDLLFSYNYIVVGTLFVVIPGALFWATRVQSNSSVPAYVAAILGMSVASLWYRWGLSYGTLPFLISVSFLPLCLSLCVQYASPGGPFSVRAAATFVFASSMAIFWTPCVLLLVPLVLGALLHTSQFRKKPLFFGALVTLVILHLPWILLFASASKVFTFLAVVPTASDLNLQMPNPKAAAHKNSFSSPLLSHHGIVKGSVLLAREFLRSINPIVLFLAIPACCGMSQPAKRLTRLIILLAIALAAFGPFIKPQMELQRFWLVAAILSVPTVALMMSQLLDRNFETLRSRATFFALGTPVIASLFLTPLWLWRVTTNQTGEKFSFATSDVYALPQAIERHGGGGRTFFSGFILHEVSNGHIAPFPLFTKRPLIASSYQHDKWKYTDAIPSEFLAQKWDGVEEYLDLMNVTLIVAHDRSWKQKFRSRPERYQEVAKIGRFVLFTRPDYVPTYFLAGAGEILNQSDDAVLVRVDSFDSTIKFNYTPTLRADSCGVVPRRISDSVTLVGLTNCDVNSSIRLSMISPIGRLVGLIGDLLTPQK